MAERDLGVDVLRGIGILAVVAGHAGSGTGIPVFAPYSFHMPLFFFLSGLFFSDAAVKAAGRSSMASARSLLLPPTLATFAYAAVSGVLGSVGFVGLYQPFSFDAALFSSFLSGGAFRFTSPYWFLTTLFFVKVYFDVVHVRLVQAVSVSARAAGVQRWIFLLIYGLMAAASVHATMRMYAAGLSDWWLIVPARVAFGAFFFYVGFMVASHRASGLFATIPALALAYVLNWQLAVGGHVLDFSMQIMRFYDLLRPFASSLLGIAFFFGLALIASHHQIARVLAYLGVNAMPIVLHHIFGFFLVNAALCLLGVISPAEVKNQYYEWRPERMWPIYICAGIAVPLLIDRYIVASVMRASSRYGSAAAPR